jgi:4-amino-4-deoxy-L-arabinose transferase-like glycosyltransferase
VILSRAAPGGAGARRLAALVIPALAVLYAPGVLDHELWTPDEPRVAAIALEASRGAWVAPTLNGTPFLEEPPLYVWCVALFYRLLGHDPPYPARVVSLLFGAGGLAATYALAAALAGGRLSGATEPERGRRVGILAVLALGLSVEHFYVAHRIAVDSALVFLTTAAAACLAHGSSEARTARRLAFLGAASSCAALAFLAKGVVGLGVPVLFLAALLLHAARAAPPGGRGRALAPFLRRLAPLLWIAPLAFAAVAGPWLILLHRELGPAGFEALFADNTLGRFLSDFAGERGHLRPGYYYLVHLPAHLAPSVLFVLGGVLFRLSRLGPEPAERAAYDIALLWAALGIAVLSLAATKSGVYLLPLFPGLAVAGGLWLDAFLSGRARGRFARATGPVLAALLAVIAAAVALAPTLLPEHLAGASPLLVASGSAAGAAAALLTVLAARREWRGRMLAAAVGGLVLVSACAVLAVVPALERTKDLSGISRAVGRLVPPGRSICALEPDEATRAMIPLYTGRPLVELATRAEVEERLAREGELYVLTVDKTHRERHRLHEALRPLAPRLLLENLRARSRAFRLHHLEK